ncbi:MAG: SH3 domain-containing protein, partial [Methyloceanibacter sp.]
AGARSYFKRAADTGSAEAAFAVGTTYDPSFIKEIGAHGIKPDVNEARAWYERAKALGDKDAHAQLLQLAKADASIAADDAAGELGLVEATKNEWVEVSSPVNVRSAPTPQAETIKVAQQGTRYYATGRQGNWVRVTDPETSEIGWIYARFVAPSEARAQ